MDLDVIYLDGRSVAEAMTRHQENRPTLIRTFEVTLEHDGDGRTVEGLCVPFNRATQVADGPDGEPYMEEFLPGAFAKTVKAPNRVWLDFEHRTSIDGFLGEAVRLEERPEGLWGEFRVLEHEHGDKALAMIRAKMLTGMSIMFQPMRHQTVGGIVQRLKVYLDRVALVRVGAYPEAQVLAVRKAVPIVGRDPFPQFDPKLAAGLDRFVTVPAKLHAPSVPLS